MKLAIVADTFHPARTSGAVQLRDLCAEFVRQGHDVTVLVASPQQASAVVLDEYHGVRVVRLKSSAIKDVGYVRRTIAELLMPFQMRSLYRQSALAGTQWDAVVWYSPSIFFGPLVRFLKKGSQCPSYLIIRDIFPEWAVDMGLMGKGLPYRFFKAIADYQYASADVIGVQTPGNKAYFHAWLAQGKGRLDVLQNWIADAPAAACSIDLRESALAGRKLFVYAGNMGVAQGMENILELVDAMQTRSDVGFVFVGRGSHSQRLRTEAAQRKLSNVLFFDEIDASEIPGLYAQCHVGIVALDVRHKTHNIPGKFISYMQAGLPVLAMINPGNDLEAMIATHAVGEVTTQINASMLREKAERLLDTIEKNEAMGDRCRDLYQSLFTPEKAVAQILQALQTRAVAS